MYDAVVRIKVQVHVYVHKNLNWKVQENQQQWNNVTEYLKVTVWQIAFAHQSAVGIDGI